MSSQKTTELYVSIGRLLVDEAMKMVILQMKEYSLIKVCVSSMKKTLYHIKYSLDQETPFGFVRFLFLINEEEVTVCVNVDYILKNSFNH